MQLRTAVYEDLDALEAFYGDIADAMADTPFDCFWRRGLYPDREMLAEAVSAGECMIADDCGTIAAASFVNHDFDDSTAPNIPWIVDCAQDETAFVHVLAAAPSYRGTGTARSLLLHLIDTLRASGMRSVRLEAASFNTPAVKLYGSCGFIPIMVVKRLYGDAEVDAIVFELPL